MSDKNKEVRSGIQVCLLLKEEKTEKFLNFY
jgi:hypothetical protein